MITENDVLNSVPAVGFVRSYIDYGMRQTTAPAAYHLAVALSILSTTCPPSYQSPFVGGTAVNLYVLLAGRSGLERKSTALRIGHDLLFHAAPHRIGDQIGSAEGLIDSLAQDGRNRQIISFSEFGKFLASAQRGYFETVKTALTDLWDSRPVQRTLAGNNVIRIEEPRLSCMAACAIPYLEKHTLLEDWTGGFMGRWALMYAKEERSVAYPIADNAGRQDLIDRLADLDAIESHGICRGLTDEAMEYWELWYEKYCSPNIVEDTNVAGLRARLPPIAQKASMLYAWELGIGSGQDDWLMSTELVHFGCLFAQLHLQSSQALASKIAATPDARLRRQVLDVFEKQNKGCNLSLGDVIKGCKLSKRKTTEILDGLVEEGTLRLNMINGKNFYMYGTYDVEDEPTYVRLHRG